jgi:hypothetical protein
MIEVRTRPFEGKIVQLETADIGRPGTAPTYVDIRSSTSGGTVQGDGSLDKEECIDEAAPKKQRTEEHVEGEEERKETTLEVDGEEADGKSARNSDYTRKRKFLKIPPAPHSILCAKPVRSMKGHSAFLTFAFSPLGECCFRHHINSKYLASYRHK